MDLLDRLDRKFRRYGARHVTEALIFCQVVVFAVSTGTPELLSRIALIPNAALNGEVWRLLTFLFLPPCSNPIWCFFSWYIFYLMGTSLENYWGALRYNVYLLIAWVATISVSFVNPQMPTGNVLIGGSVFLAFAWLNPNFELLIFFLLPVKIKWLALITWIMYGVTVIFGTWTERLMVFASVGNFLVFFAPEIYLRIRSGHRKMARTSSQWGASAEAFHTCTGCGATDKSHPSMDFRYCSECDGNPCYCANCLDGHEHIKP